MSDQQQTRLIDGVFEGGGVKGIGLTGALSAVEAAGYTLNNVAGTSAGAITAALVAAGYTADEIKKIIFNLDFKQIMDQDFLGRLPLGVAFHEFHDLGLYKGDFFLGLMRDLLAARGKRTFKDLIMPGSEQDARYRYRLRVIVSDITQGRMLALPQDIRSYGTDPDDLEIALAVRMSMSIPLFFAAVKLPNAGPPASVSTIVDGGLLSNFPVELFDSDGPPEWPTFGFRLVRSGPPPAVKHQIFGPLSEIAAMFFTATSAHDTFYLTNDKFARTITIDTGDIASTNFNLTDAEKQTLFDNGVAAAKDFLDHWDFDAYKALYRSGAPQPRRREQVLQLGSTALGTVVVR
jgi:NTE family protein